MGFKINQTVADQPKYCDYIQEKVDIATENNAVYELTDEDNRIQALYDDENLITKDVIRSLSRVKIGNKDEFLTVTKSVDFHTRDEKDRNQLGAYRDRYVTTEGIVDIPVKTTSTTADSEAPTPTKRVYTIPFTKQNVDKYAEQNDGITFRFYEGSTQSTRSPNSIPTVSNLDYFKDATWDELKYGREKKVLNSMINRLPEVRKELGTPKEEVNKKEVTIKNELQVEPSNKEQLQQQQGQQGQSQSQQQGGQGSNTTNTNTNNNSTGIINKGGSTGSNKRS